MCVRLSVHIAGVRVCVCESVCLFVACCCGRFGWFVIVCGLCVLCGPSMCGLVWLCACVVVVVVVVVCVLFGVGGMWVVCGVLLRGVPLFGVCHRVWCVCGVIIWLV